MKTKDETINKNERLSNRVFITWQKFFGGNPVPGKIALYKISKKINADFSEVAEGIAGLIKEGFISYEKGNGKRKYFLPMFCPDVVSSRQNTLSESYR